MLHAIPLFLFLRVVPAVKIAHEVACDAADALELDRLQRPVKGNTITGRWSNEKLRQCVHLRSLLLFDIIDIIDSFVVSDIRETGINNNTNTGNT